MKLVTYKTISKSIYDLNECHTTDIIRDYICTIDSELSLNNLHADFIEYNLETDIIDIVGLHTVIEYDKCVKLNNIIWPNYVQNVYNKRYIKVVSDSDSVSVSDSDSDWFHICIQVDSCFSKKVILELASK